MKIKVASIQPNPFRDLTRNPLQRPKIETLKSSISETGFWDNVVVRPHPTDKGVYQLAYGHNRLGAVRELGIQEIDVPVRSLDDVTMLKMMAAENMSDWSATPATINEAVWAAKQYLDDLFDRYETLEEFRQFFSANSQVLDSELQGGAYLELRDSGSGYGTISRLIGIKTTRVKDALVALQEESAQSHAARLRAREERQRLKAEAARLEAVRLREEAERKAQQEQERKAKQEQKRIEAEERRKAEEAAAADMDDDEAEAILKEFEEQEKRREAQAKQEQKKQEEEDKKAQAELKKAEEAAKKAEREAKEAEARQAKIEEQRQRKEAELSVLEIEGVDRAAYELFRNQATAEAFRSQVKFHKVPKDGQRELAQALSSLPEVNGSSMAGYFLEHCYSQGIKERPVIKKNLPPLGRYVESTVVKALGNVQDAYLDLFSKLDAALGDGASVGGVYDLTKYMDDDFCAKLLASHIQEVKKLMQRLRIDVQPEITANLDRRAIANG